MISPVSGKADLKSFIDLPYRLHQGDPAWVPPLRSEVAELLNPLKNPFFQHADVQLFLARRGDETVGRISAHIDHLALAQPAEQGMGPGTGNWGLFDAVDDAVAAALIRRAESWLAQHGMRRVLAPISMSVWEEPGLQISGHDHPPTVMMGQDPRHYRAWIEAAGYTKAKSLLTYDLDILKEFPPLIGRIIQSGERNERITVRKVEIRHFEREAKIILDILNDAWSDNWGFVPFSDAEIDYAGKKLKPLVREDLIRIAEYEGKPVAFMITLPDVNEPIKAIGGKLFPFGWAKMLWWLRKPKVQSVRVPLMGVVKRLQSTRMASQLAFMMIEYIRRAAVEEYGATRGEIGWILDDNQGMVAIADALKTQVNREYLLYEKSLT
ncbi:N-acetyltransferase [Altererythrobacter aquiaggeris]|uniref:N-acetyltransferase n=1 Tax=Aestuarierythrobacter aquiaggeris TaxID=1898396 RepID=UPI00301B46BD